MERIGRRAAGRLEHAVLTVLWAADGPRTPAQVQAALPEGLAYTTVSTILGRLHDKGAVSRDRVGPAHAYAPLVREDAVAARQLGELLVDGADRRAVLRGFVTAIDPADVAVLRELLDGTDPR